MPTLCPGGFLAAERSRGPIGPRAPEGHPPIARGANPWNSGVIGPRSPNGAAVAQPIAFGVPDRRVPFPVKPSVAPPVFVGWAPPTVWRDIGYVGLNRASGVPAC